MKHGKIFVNAGTYDADENESKMTTLTMMMMIMMMTMTMTIMTTLLLITMETMMILPLYARLIRYEGMMLQDGQNALAVLSYSAHVHTESLFCKVSF